MPISRSLALPFTIVAWALSVAGTAVAEDKAGPKPRIVVTGFGPFAGRPVNASSILAKAIAAKHTDWNVRALEIPVIWGEPAKVMAEVSAQPWDLWIAFGEGAPGSFSIETKAANARGDGRDNARERPSAPLIKEGGPEKLTLGADSHVLAKRLREMGFAARVSSSAGRYLCEEMLYTLLLAQQDDAKRNVLFIHVPPYGSPLNGGTTDAAAPVKFDEATIDRVAEVVAPELVAFLTKQKQ